MAIPRARVVRDRGVLVKPTLGDTGQARKIAPPILRNEQAAT